MKTKKRLRAFHSKTSLPSLFAIIHLLFLFVNPYFAIFLFFLAIFLFFSNLFKIFLDFMQDMEYNSFK